MRIGSSSGRSSQVLHSLLTPTLLGWLSLIGLPAGSFAEGVVNSCTEADLRAALAGGGTVTFACDGTITLTDTLVITNDTVIDAAGRDVTISGGGAVRIFSVASGTQSLLAGLKIVNGVHGTEGAGIFNSGSLRLHGCTLSNNVVSASGLLRGGALLNLGSAEIVDCTFVTNRAFAGSTYGGAIYSAGTLAVRQSTFSGNAAQYGAAIASVTGFAEISPGVTNCTFWRNVGAVVYDSRSFRIPGNLSLVHCTFAENSGAALGGSFEGSRFWVANSILGFTSFPFQDAGNNLFWTAAQNAIDPSLGPLQDNGGPTWTMALHPDSPAIDQGNSTYCTSTDQRGIARPYGPTCDIGAYEATFLPEVPLFRFSSPAFSTNEGAGLARITVIRTGSSAGGGQVRFSVSAGTAAAFHDFTAWAGELVFANGQTSLTFTVQIKDDAVPESNESINLSLSPKPGNPGVGEPSTAVLTIIDNDPVQPGVLAFAQSGYSVSEDSHTPRIWVTRTGGTNGSVTVEYATMDYPTNDNPALAGIDYVSSFGTLHFADGETAKPIVLQLIADPISEPPETFSVILGNPGGGATLGVPSSTVVTIVDERHLVVGCDEASLRAAVSVGGTVVLACNGTIVLTSPLIVSNGCHIDAANYNPTLSGGNTTRVFMINPGVRLQLSHIALHDGMALGTNSLAQGVVNRPGGPGEGGAAYNEGGTLVAADCAFLRNRVQGGVGSPAVSFGTAAGAGGPGRGGAVFVRRGEVTLTRCLLDANEARGGRGGFGNIGAVGGESAGGGIYGTNSQIQLLDCELSRNTSIGGRGTRANGSLGGSGLGSGGALAFDSGIVTVSRTIFAKNRSSAEYVNHARGGAIVVRAGSLSMTDTLLTGNLAEGGLGLLIGSSSGLPGGHGYGGALHLIAGTAELVSSTLASNVALGGVQQSGNYAGSGLGGGLYNAQATLSVLNCTVAHNESQAGEARALEGGGYGGGLYNDAGLFVLAHVTIAANASRNSPGTSPYGFDGVEQGGGIYSGNNGLVSLFNTILANTFAGSNAFGVLTDGGNNLSSDSSCNFNQPGSMNNTDPKLGPLADYTGPTPTMALLASSSAIDAASSASCAPTDQRGRPRPAGAACDIGAFESSQPYTVLGRLLGYIPPPGSASVGSESSTAQVDVFGKYALHGLTADAHVVKPESALVVFVPKTRDVNVVADTVGIDFTSYRTNGIVITRLGPGSVRGVFAGEAGASYEVQFSPGLPANWWTHSILSGNSEGLIQWTDGDSTVGPGRFFRVKR
jgi:hypothetical protein